MEAELIEKAASGDRQAFAALVAGRYDFIHAVAWRWCGERQDAEDVAQEVCIKLASAIRGFRGTSRFSTWLYTITLNVARDHMRKRRRENWRDADYLREQAVAGGGRCARLRRNDDFLARARGPQAAEGAASRCGRVTEGRKR